MKRLLRPKPLFAAVLLLALAVGTFVAWRGGWLRHSDYADSPYRGYAEFTLDGARYCYATWPGLRRPQEADFGGKLGEAASDNPLLDGAAVYTAVGQIPGQIQGSTLVIADWTPYGYRFFYRATRDAPEIAVGETAAALFEAWGLPNSCDGGAVSSGARETYFGPTQTRVLVEVASALENAGEAAREAAFAAAEEAGEDPALDACEVELQDGLYTLRLTYYPVLRALAFEGGWYPVTEEQAAILHRQLYRPRDRRLLATLAPRED